MRVTILIVLYAAQLRAQALPGTRPLERTGDLALEMVAGIDRYLMRALDASVDSRGTPNRDRFRKVIGAVDSRIGFDALVLDATSTRSSLILSAPGYAVHAVRWPVLAGVDAEGLLLKPSRAPVANVVALPDADSSPEALAGLAPGLPVEAQIARRLAESGCQVLVPVLIDRKDTWSGNPAIGFTNQSHREWIYRMAYEMGRHIIGYEVQKVLAAVDWFERSAPGVAIAAAGQGEGGLVAFYSAALDTRIRAAWVAGHFRPRQSIWQEPIYRNVWSLLKEFGDAEIAGMIAPRALVIQAARYPEVKSAGDTKERRGAAPGSLAAPSFEEVRKELDRARGAFRLTREDTEALRAFLDAAGHKGTVEQAVGLPAPAWLPDPGARMKRQVRQLADYTQELVRESPRARARFWSRADASSAARWEQTTEEYRNYLWEEILGKLPPPSEPLSVEARLIYEKPAFRGWEVVIPVYPDVYAYGILLLPRDFKPGTRLPVVVAQHGLNGRPQDLVEPSTERLENVYRRYAARLAEMGYAVYAPQNPYIGEEQFRVLLRKAHPLKLSLFSFIVAQHQRTLDWLAAQPYVDPQRIAFYGLSYGGKTAMRVPPLEKRYALSICSGDFNEWIWKITSTDHSFSYMFTREHDMLEFDLGNTMGYYEMATLIAPRPFMVERGHKDGVGIDEWVAYEFAKVRRFYTSLGLAGRTTIEFFDGAHAINGAGTFEFLRKFR